MTRKKTGFNKSKYDQEFQKNYFDRINYSVPKHTRFKELVSFAAKSTGTTINGYITKAVNNQLEIDGISIDMLPPLEEQDEEMEPNDSGQEES